MIPYDIIILSSLYLFTKNNEIMDSLSLAETILAILFTIIAGCLIYISLQITRIKRRNRYYKPRYIILVRHGQSEGNVDVKKYASVGDPNISLTELGRKQANDAGKKLKEFLGNTPVFCYYSPYRRSKQTAELLLPHLETKFKKEDVRLREREFAGSFQRDVVSRADEMKYSRFFWRPDGGESLADVYDRVTLFMENLWRDFKGHPDMHDSATVLISHGLTIRLFAMRWLHWTTDTFELTKNPDNCDNLILELQPPDEYGNSYYQLTNESLSIVGLHGRGELKESTKELWGLKEEFKLAQMRKSTTISARFRPRSTSFSGANSTHLSTQNSLLGQTRGNKLNSSVSSLRFDV
mmetsp:Transcript_631/g.763  ORF Transcript_631/g.763 Transcript_631/m.763 type:complete len:352 (+) Transcript_631:72-1127(+)